MASDKTSTVVGSWTTDSFVNVDVDVLDVDEVFDVNDFEVFDVDVWDVNDVLDVNDVFDVDGVVDVGRIGPSIQVWVSTSKSFVDESLETTMTEVVPLLWLTLPANEKSS